MLDGTNTSLLEDSNSSSNSPNTSPQDPIPVSTNNQVMRLKSSVSQHITPVKMSNCAELQRNLQKKTPSLISSFSLSSPSAAVLFGLNSGSFSIPNDLGGGVNSSYHNHNTSASTRLLASRVDLISGNSEVQAISALRCKSEGSTGHNVHQCPSDENSTDLSCMDDVVIAAFVNDFSYEVVQK